MKTIFKKAGGLLVALAFALTLVVPGLAFADSQSYQSNPWTGAYGGASYGTPYQYQYQYQYPTGSPYQYQFQTDTVYRQYLLNVIAQLQALLDSYRIDRDRDDDGDSEIEITTRSATNIEDDGARLRGEIDFNSSDRAYAWFEYGEDEDDLDEDTPHIRIDEDDDDEDFSVRVTDLDEDERFFFRAVGEDEDGRIDRGSIKNFRTDDNGGGDDEPDVRTEEAENITDDSAELHGEVDMNDFRNGTVFFVYGQDEDQVDDVEDDYDSYSDVDEDGDDLQKVRVDSDLDGSEDYALDIDGLDSNTDYFFAICVEYEDEDDDETLTCGSTEEFETDN